MSYSFEKLQQLVDMRGKLPHKGKYVDLGVNSKTVRVWHHSLTKSSLAGSTAEAFARFHVGTNGWPGIGYHFVIEPQNLIKGPDGRTRAKIIWCHNPGVKSYHVGDSNKSAIGICVSGDYRTEELSEATLLSISELHAALVRDGIGKDDKAHNQMPGYSWKPCCQFDYKAAFFYNKPLNVSKPSPLPDTYTIQEGDTLWAIANELKDLTLEDLIAANPGIKPQELEVGQIIKLGKSKNIYTRPPATPKKPQNEYKYPMPTVTIGKGKLNPKQEILKLQKALNAANFKCGAEDGIWGPKTQDALTRFQKVYTPQEIDSIFGPNTRTKLQAVLKSKGY
ncbi:LysM peptidoglycan-binding domain-containing protein [Fictibacillus sp. 5RED26]|uniref:LysM peptidoglycan-binding domain-containing protein n=1 Tax=Fictibacillus sp. 5RED26 TaxID=2745876 RepID=UPI0018CE4662|nr:LysM peptidoglycan-binding domain-containing protein [Fictibacillus sp. 5RED26]MBH0159105.1 LysM peptidoglycan-binding domain-containing protein [Fictibacillus sp. 5RED26]